jgi:two-component system nitrogen regulation response regulator GlnG/two-component system response regulator HydG
LDEIGELSATAQAHLLRVMDQGDYQRLGEATQRRSDFRLIAATNRDPSALNHDFAARFPLRVRLPGLNERLEDVPLLLRRILFGLCAASEGLVDRFFERRQGQVAEPRVEPELVEWLLRHHYTTHVRELERPSFSVKWRKIPSSKCRSPIVRPSNRRSRARAATSLRRRACSACAIATYCTA